MRERAKSGVERQKISSSVSGTPRHQGNHNSKYGVRQQTSVASLCFASFTQYLIQYTITYQVKLNSAACFVVYASNKISTFFMCSVIRSDTNANHVLLSCSSTLSLQMFDYVTSKQKKLANSSEDCYNYTISKGHLVPVRP